MVDAVPCRDVEDLEDPIVAVALALSCHCRWSLEQVAVGPGSVVEVQAAAVAVVVDPSWDYEVAVEFLREVPKEHRLSEQGQGCRLVRDAVDTDCHKVRFLSILDIKIS